VSSSVVYSTRPFLARLFFPLSISHHLFLGEAKPFASLLPTFVILFPV
jgi:hypothetical protein